jgi:hypothetical protein
MNHKTRRAVETAACERRYGIADAKGSEYSGAGSTYKETGADTLANFKLVGDRLGISPVLVLLTYWLKHVDSITTAVREAELYNSNTDVGRSIRYAQGEGIVSRLDDARNYLDLLECLLIDTDAIPSSDKEEMVLTVTDSKGVHANIASHTWNELVDVTSSVEREALTNAGLVEGLDGVWRGATTIDKSVKNPGERQTPIYARPAVFTPTQDAIRETGELT